MAREPVCDKEYKAVGKAKRPLTDLELTALGIIWKQQGCSAYDVMAEFSESLTARFRSGAGSVYPLMQRIYRDRLIRKEASPRGKQSRSLYFITDKGKQALSDWLSPPLTDLDVALTVDPIRTRVYFLKLLPHRQRLDFLDEAIQRLKVQLQQCEIACENLRNEKNTYAELAMRGAMRMTRARIAWLEEVKNELG